MNIDLKTLEELSEYFLDFMEIKFGMHEIAMNMAFSILKEVDKNKEINNFIRIYEQCCTGKKDECAWRYYVLV